MRVWIVAVYEPLPFDDPRTKPQRCGMLAKALLKRNHVVELWTAAFDHVSHQPLAVPHPEQRRIPNFGLRLIQGRGYQRDRSFSRLFHNRQVAREFLREAVALEQKPDVIFATVPVLELAEAAVRFATARNIPIVVDIRDLWPETYLDLFPPSLRWLGRQLFFSEFRRARFVFGNATRISAISQSYLQYGLKHARRQPVRGERSFPLGSPDFAAGTSQHCAESDRLILERFNFRDPDLQVATYIGTFSRFTDVATILSAAKRLTDLDRLRIAVVGAGDAEEEFKRVASRLPNVVMTGWLDATEGRAILRRSIVGLVAYSKDALMSLPNKPFEYMAMGLPLLSSLPGELYQLIQENGIGRSYKAGDPVSLASELRWFHENPLAARDMGTKARRLFLGQFEADLVYDDFSRYLEEIGSIDGRRQYES